MRLALLTVFLLCCGKPKAVVTSDAASPAAEPISLESVNDPSTIEIASWNIEWFGAPDFGPTDEALQLDRVATVLEQLDVDLMGVEEVVSEVAFAEVMARLPNKHAVLASDAERGREFYSDDEQKVGLIMHERFSVTRARLILTEHVLDFAGRPPLEVQLSFEEAGQTRSLVVIVVHLKASEDKASYALRLRSAQALKDYLDSEHPTRWVAVIGDFNDDLTSSITYLEWSPFRSLQSEPDKLRFVTKPLSDARESTTVGHGRPIDHHLITNELAERYLEGSARVLRLDKAIKRYGQTTSDHFPVLSRYDLR